MSKQIPTLSKFYKVRIRTERYNKGTTSSGKDKWVLDEVENNVISHEHYNNIILAVPYFRKKVCSLDAGREYLKYGYTRAGYMPIRNTSVSPSGEHKIIRYFEIIDNESEA